jgi:hypothetical protein
MTRAGLFSFLAIVLLSGITSAQETHAQNATPSATGKAASTRAITLSGAIASDGKTFLSDQNETRWTVKNPDALKGHEGHQVTLKGRAEPGKAEIQVLKVRIKPEVTSAARLGDSAFRR